MDDKGKHKISEDIVSMDIKEFREKGYLQELNRRFLHPLVLALSVLINKEGESLAEIWDYRDDDEGIRYDIANSAEERKTNLKTKKEFIDNEITNRRKKRIKKLGYFIEPVGEIEPDHIFNEYKVDINDIKVGSTYFVYHDRKFYEIMIGAGIHLYHMFIDFPDEKRVKVTVDELFSRIPDNWIGEVIKFNATI